MIGYLIGALFAFGFAFGMGFPFWVSVAIGGALFLIHLIPDSGITHGGKRR